MDAHHYIWLQKKDIWVICKLVSQEIGNKNPEDNSNKTPFLVAFKAIQDQTGVLSKLVLCIYDMELPC